MKASEEPLRIGVSSCLLGQEVRFDGGHKRNAFLMDQLAHHVEWIPVCPEVELGMGIPRPSIRLEREGSDLRMVDPRAQTDHTAAMKRFARKRARALRDAGLHGYVFKKDSPSCGVHRVKVYSQQGAAQRDGRGLFAQALIDALPELPVEEEGRLQDPRLRENFIERIFAQRRLRQLFRARWRSGEVVAFHTAHELQLMAHSPQAYRELGRLVGTHKRYERAAFRQRYESGFMRALARLATPGRTTNVLQHMAGYVSDRLEPALRRELTALIDDYRNGLVPLVVPVTLLHHHARRFAVDYLLGQVFLSPHPRELMLRNHA